MESTLDTTKMEAVVEMKSFSGSAFAVNSAGEQIFINARIMERMNLEEGGLVTAYVLPNYADKRQTIPWRAMRVDVPRDIPQQTSPDTRKFVETDNAAWSSSVTMTPTLDNEIMRLLWADTETGRLWTDKEVSDKISANASTTLDTASPAECHRACTRLYERAVICRVDFSTDPTRMGSLIMWAATLRDFED